MMQITELYPPTNGGTLFFLRAQSTRKRTYQCHADRRGKVTSVFREDSSKRFLLPVVAPKALRVAARRAIRKAVRS